MTPKLKLRALLMATTIATFHSFPSFALDKLATPTGENVVAGAATFDRPAAGTLNVTQSTDRAVINWDRFDIGKDAKTEFFQPNAGALAVNRVMSGQDPTQILGTLKSNGQLMILDKNGVFVGKDARIDVGSIVASTGNVTNADVMDMTNTKLRIRDMGNATIENRGTINVADAGLAALVAPTVVNRGTINAKLGRVALGGSSAATVDMTGDGLISFAVDSKLEHAMVDNRGDIFAEAGTVQMQTSVAKGIVDNAINNSGIVDVSSVTQEAGKIVLRGAETAAVKGDLLAGGQAGGGQITIDANDVSLMKGSHIAADTTFTGTGGKVTVRAGNSIDAAGHLSANGEEGGGRVTLAAGDNVNVTGRTEARSTGIGTGGVINISSMGDETHIASRLNAGGIDGAGRIHVTAANKLTLDEKSRLMAESLSTGTGGNVRLEGGDVAMNGRVMVGGTEGGGVVRTDATGNLDVGGRITGNGSVVGTGARVALNAAGDVALGNGIDVTGRSGGGTVAVTGSNITLAENARLRAMGLDSGLPDFATNPGGTIRLNAVNDLNAAGTMMAGGFNDGGGKIRLAGTNVDMSGRADARGLNSGTGGTVFIDGTTVNADGTINTSGADTGGAVRLTGTDVAFAGTVRSNAFDNGVGGNVSLQGTNSNAFSGAIQARGGATTGNGGNVTFNTPNTIDPAGTVDVTAANGTSGTFTH